MLFANHCLYVFRFLCDCYFCFFVVSLYVFCICCPAYVSYICVMCVLCLCVPVGCLVVFCLCSVDCPCVSWSYPGVALHDLCETCGGFPLLFFGFAVAFLCVVCAMAVGALCVVCWLSVIVHVFFAVGALRVLCVCLRVCMCVICWCSIGVLFVACGLPECVFCAFSVSVPLVFCMPAAILFPCVKLAFWFAFLLDFCVCVVVRVFGWFSVGLLSMFYVPSLRVFYSFPSCCHLCKCSICRMYVFCWCSVCSVCFLFIF